MLCLLIYLCIPDLNGQSAYEEEVVTPDYDPGDSTHFLISTTDDWAHINDSAIEYFFVEPHEDYGTVVIHSGGTQESWKYICLYNGNNDHPAKLDRSEQANVKIVFDDAHYWVVDRMSTFDSGYDNCFLIRNRSSNIILNRLHLSGFQDAINIRGPSSPPFTENITVQNSRFDRMTPEGIDGDHIAILLSGEIWNHDRTIVNTKILNNEFRDCNDGILLANHPDQGYQLDYRGTIIDHNHIYVDREVYTDGRGNPDTLGIRAFTENAIDLKGGSEDPDNPVVVSNNILWGFRRTDTNGGGSGSAGSAIAGHYHVKNVVIKNNLIFNANRGITFADPAGMEFSVENAIISGNILYDIGYSTSGDVEYATYFYHSKNVTFANNTLVMIEKRARWLSLYGDELEMAVDSNIVADAYEQTGKRSATTRFADNTFFNTLRQQVSDGKYYPDMEIAVRKDTTFVTDRHTTRPREITLPGVLLTVQQEITGRSPETVADRRLLGNYPNPFRGYTRIWYYVPEPSYVKLKVYDMVGVEVAEIVSEQQAAGNYEVDWEPVDCPPGVYFCELVTGGARVAHRVLFTE
jgi:hypothetical protein